ncbi:MAG TPA: asparagine synthase (glutamine-hydrolyzing) [Verrucomicrobiota bacterium]|nr:asparagine synthase (glutamine-hydrolyzing) [Verrucomicrobiales bacterium]HRI16451.1 asparagine synthase (glutamine-hydrolyzing) [Verrucomicrobiota bacterium]
MCGICGVIGFPKSPSGNQPQAQVEAMLQALHHRGPNAMGAAEAAGAILGATRLAVRGINDPNQPSVDPTTGVIVVCNGEIDNHRELRQWLEDRGRPVPKGSDVEVLPGLYLELGEAFVDRLIGAFALSVWDPRHQRLVLARDRAGERPLFFTTGFGGLVFASEIAALQAADVGPLTFSELALRGYLQFGNFVAPTSPFREVEKMAPGELLVFEAGAIRRRRYWRWPILTQPKQTPSLDAFDQVFREAVRRQTDVDVDFAVFLSGGLDSSLVAAVARSLHPTQPLRGYTVRFREESFDEGEFATAVARRLGLEMESVWVGPEDIPVELPALVRRVGEPLADPAWLPAALLSRAAAQNYRMTLVGEGADELFGGYPTYLGVGVAQRFSQLPQWFRNLSRRGISMLPPSDKKITVSYLLKRFVAGADLDGMVRHQLWNSNVAPEILHRLGVEPADFPISVPASPVLLDRVQQWDLEVPLAEGLLTKADRASMSSALELRAPFLDLGVLEFAATLPPEARVRGFTTKVFLKRYAQRYLPNEIVHRRKRGLSVPLSRWLRGPLRDWAAAQLASPGLREIGLRPTVAAELLRDHVARRADHARALWTLIVLGLWLDWAADLRQPGQPSPRGS